MKKEGCMKNLIWLAVLAFPALARADLSCQIYNLDGDTISANMQVHFGPQRNVLMNDSNGVAIGHLNGETTITMFNQNPYATLATYYFGDAQTRCVASSTIRASSTELNVDLYSWNSCGQTPVDHVQSAYKGTLSFGGQNFYLTCSDL